MLRVWGRRNSFNVQKVMWLVGELGLAHEHIAAGGPYGGLDAPDFRAMNPNGRIPVIEEGGLAVWESHTILRYLAARHSGGGFWSDDPGRRSKSDRWMDWAQTSLQPAFLNGVFWGWFRTPEAERNGPAIEQSLEATGALFRMLDGILAGQPFLGGEQLSLADIPAGAMLFRYFTLDIERPELPAVSAWYERLRARAAYREHVMVSYEELRGHLRY